MHIPVIISSPYPVVHRQAAEFIYNFRTNDSQGQILDPSKNLLSQLRGLQTYQ
jgi:hypothetical protein